jgi:phage gp46-like protein
MTDIALIWDPVNGRADFAIANGDLVMDNSLHTAVIISLFCDRLAAPGDTINDNTDDRRGWWGDTPLPGASDPSAGLDLTGSRLWLLARALQNQNTLNQAISYAKEALQWMIDDGVAGSVNVTASFPATPPQALEMIIDIYQAGASAPQTYSFAWSAS